MKNKINLNNLPKALCGIGNKPNEYKYVSAINEMLLKTTFAPDASDIGKEIQADIDRTNPTKQTHEELSDHYRLKDNDQINAVRNYTGGSSKLNKHLFETGGDHDKINHDKMMDYGYDMRQLDAALDQRKAHKDFHVYSGIPFNPNEVKNTDGLIHLPAYTSTSLKFAKAAAFSRNFSDHDDPEHTSHNHILKIHIPEGSKHGGYIDQHSSYKDKEHEFLMKRNSIIRVEPVPETHIASNGIDHVKVHVWNAHIVESGIGVDHTNDSNYETEDRIRQRAYDKEVAGYKLSDDKLTPEGVHHAMNTLITHNGYINSDSTGNKHITDVSHDGYDDFSEYGNKINKFLSVNGFTHHGDQLHNKETFVHNTKPIQVEINKDINHFSFSNVIAPSEITKQHVVNALAAKLTKQDVINELAKDSHKYAHGVTGQHKTNAEMIDKVLSINKKLNSMGFSYLGTENNEYGVIHNYTHPDNITAKITHTNQSQENHGYAVTISDAPQTQNKIEPIRKELTHESLHNIINDIPTSGTKKTSTFNGSTKTVYTTDVYHQSVDSVDDHFNKVQSKLKQLGFSENPDSVDDNKLYEHPTKGISVTLAKNHENKWSSVDVWKKK